MSSSTWFKRIKQGILTSTKEKKDVPDGLWFRCPGCKKTSTIDEIRDSFWVCPSCNHHNRIDAEEYFEFLYDEGVYELLFDNIVSKDKLGFVDLKKYKDR